MKKILALFVFAVLAGAGIYFFPVFKGAVFLQKYLDFERFTYRLEVELDEEELAENQRKLLNTLADMMGLEQAAMYDLTLEGSVDGDIIYAMVYPAGCEEPLLELYLGEEEDVINGALLYNTVRNHYGQQSGLLDAIFPVWEDHEYVSFVQLEQLFGVDLSDLRDFELSSARGEFSLKRSFLLLCLMSYKKSDSGVVFEKTMESANAELILHDSAAPFVEVKMSVRQPVEALEKVQPVLPGLEIFLSDKEFRMVDKMAVEVRFGQGGRLSVPDDLVSQQTIDAIARLRSIVGEVMDRIH